MGIIPLNKIASHCISATVVERAKQIVGDEHANLALDLIGYDDELHKAMAYVFGSAFICSDMNSAKQVAFDASIRCKAVTIDGEVFNPEGLTTRVPQSCKICNYLPQNNKSLPHWNRKSQRCNAKRMRLMRAIDARWKVGKIVRCSSMN